MGADGVSGAPGTEDSGSVSSTASTATTMEDIDDVDVRELVELGSDGDGEANGGGSGPGTAGGEGTRVAPPPAAQDRDGPTWPSTLAWPQLQQPSAITSPACAPPAHVPARWPEARDHGPRRMCRRSSPLEG